MFLECTSLVGFFFFLPVLFVALFIALLQDTSLLWFHLVLPTLSKTCFGFAFSARMVDSTLWQWLQTPPVLVFCFYFCSFQRLKPWMIVEELGMICFKIANSGSTGEPDSFGLVELLSIYLAEAGTHWRKGAGARLYWGFSTFCSVRKIIKSCFRALFPKLYLKGCWTESSSLTRISGDHAA